MTLNSQQRSSQASFMDLRLRMHRNQAEKQDRPGTGGTVPVFVPNRGRGTGIGPKSENRSLRVQLLFLSYFSSSFFFATTVKHLNLLRRDRLIRSNYWVLELKSNQELLDPINNNATTSAAME
ncbi:uncharacterized protein LOC113300559 [Papaver somniferum]|uniref:uncharacterized protein LOC113300559 n=1 Tax=Papaver somniferum TaxID=3469 RepID=UPI000E6FA198|nr:uncharacterized protein LOC113300559 [Papaver somniferum]